MTVRNGRAPREPEMPSWRASDGRGNPLGDARGRGPNGNGGPDGKRGLRLPGFVRFLLFAGGLAVLVLVVLLTALRPLVRAGIVGWAWDNPSSITRFPFIGDFVREDLGSAITAPAGTDPTEAVFTVNPRETISQLAPRLLQGGFITSEHAFLFVALEANLNTQLTAGDFVLRHNMTPAEVVAALVRDRVQVTTVKVTFREGLRLEQQTALLETITSGVDPAAYYQLAKHPTQKILADYPWLTEAGLPAGASLEGFLYPATYELVTSANGGPYTVTDAEALIRMQLDKFYAAVGQQRMTVPKARGLNFYQILSLASIVQHETAQPDEKALVAGVYQNRLDRLHGFVPLLGSEPTVIYARDTDLLATIPIEEWKTFFFWEAIKTKIADLQVSKAMQPWQTYQVTGLIPGPISTPTTIDIDAALNPDQTAGYLYFLALPNTGKNIFAKTLAEQTANIHKYYP
ncbi:MAG TPA: endolytic transglycosylase MltG [Candidatus Dormibacteraeota bacterium]|nr:endolytic transglycosylase MltG [Candidatus Dormibacteraeota bacterium]